MHDERDWAAQLLDHLGRSGTIGRATRDYLSTRGVVVGTHTQPTGARWTIGGKIQLDTGFLAGAPDAPYAMSLVVHETCHLQQGLLNALSVYGELDAWRVQFHFLRSLTGQYSDRPQRDGVIADLMALRLTFDRQVLRIARALMQEYAGPSYRIGLLPLYPLPSEVAFRLTGRQPPDSSSPLRTVS